MEIKIVNCGERFSKGVWVIGMVKTVIYKNPARSTKTAIYKVIYKLSKEIYGGKK